MKASIVLIATIILLLTSCSEKKHNKAAVNTVSETGEVTVPEIIRSTTLPSTGQLIAYIYVGDSPRKKMTSIGSNYKLKLVDLALGSQYQITIEFVFDSPSHCEVNLATQKKIIKISAGDNNLVFGDTPYAIFDNDNDGKSNIVELADGTYSCAPPKKRADLAFYTPNNWGAAVVIRNDNACTLSICSNSELLTNAGAIYVSHALQNQGAGNGGNFIYKIYINNDEVHSGSSDAIKANQNGYITNIKLTNLPVGEHSLKLVVDTDNSIDESNESNNEYSVTFAIVDSTIAGWQKAVPIETGNTSWSPQVAMDSSGNAIAVWVKHNGTRSNIWARHFALSAGWGATKLISVADWDARSPQIVTDSNGNMMAVWDQWDGTRSNIWANRFIFGAGWGKAKLIETDDIDDAWKPQVAADGNGNIIVVWQQSDGIRENIWANRFTPSTGWGTAELIEVDNSGGAWRPQVAMNSSGEAVVVWFQSNGSRENIWANHFDPSSGWGTAKLIETDNVGNAKHPQVSVDSYGNALVVWQQSDGTRFNIWANRFVFSLGWGTAKLIETDNMNDAWHPQVVTDSNGNALVVWYQYDDTYSNIWANRLAFGSDWGVAEIIETNNAGDAISPQLAVDSSGSAVAVWYQNDGIRENTWANHFTSGIGWGSAKLIENDNAMRGDSPQVAIDSLGNAVVVWQQSDETRFNIWANHFKVQ